MGAAVSNGPVVGFRFMGLKDRLGAVAILRGLRVRIVAGVWWRADWVTRRRGVICFLFCQHLGFWNRLIRIVDIDIVYVSILS